MSRLEWTDGMLRRLQRAIEEEGRGYGAANRIAARLGLEPRQVHTKLRALERRDRPRTVEALLEPGRVRICRCGAEVRNEPTTDYRFCETCRGTNADRLLARFARAWPD